MHDIIEDNFAGFGDLVEELQSEIDRLLAQDKARVTRCPSSELPELLAAAIREIEGLRKMVSKSQGDPHDVRTSRNARSAHQ